MKKTTRYILVLLVLVVLVGGAVAALYFYQTGTEEEAGESSAASAQAETVHILQKEDADIQSISVKTGEYAYTLEPQPPEKSSESSESSESAQSDTPAVVFTVSGLEKYNVNTSQVTTMAKTLYNLSAAKALGTVSNLEEYGLDGDGQAKAVLTYADGTADTLIIGNVPGASTGRYVLKDGKVYVATGLSESLFAGPGSFLSTNVFTVRTLKGKDKDGNDTDLADVITSMSLSGSNYPQQIAVSYSENNLNAHKITAPMPVDASPDRMTEITTALKTITATEVVKADYALEDLTKYGLDKPFATVEYVMNTEHHKISVSAADAQGNRYMIADDNGIVYKIAAATVASWAESTLMNLRSNYVLLPNIKDVKTLSLTQTGLSVRFDAQRVLNSEKSTEDSPNYDLTVTSGGADISYENAYQPLYKSLISMSILNVDAAQYDKTTPVLTVKYEYFSGSQADELKFYAIGDQDRYAVETNGVFTGQMRKASLDAVMALIAPAAKNETITAVE